MLLVKQGGAAGLTLLCGKSDCYCGGHSASKGDNSMCRKALMLLCSLMSVQLVLPLNSAEIEQTEPPNNNWRPGEHYTVLSPSQSTIGKEGEVEVREFFLYSSPWSRDFQPYLKAWLATEPRQVVYVRKPAIVMPHSRLQARMYYTLRSLGREDLHDKMFDWATDAARAPIYHTDYSRTVRPDVDGIFRLNLEFAELNGIDGERFSKVYRSEEIEREATLEEMLQHVYHIVGTSTFVINGKYCVSVQRITERGIVGAKDYERLLDLIKYLVDKERNSDNGRVAK